MSNPTELPDERAEFESAQRKYHRPLAEADLRQDKIGNYYNHVTQANWSMWQARAALARRAKPEGEAPQAKDTPQSMAQSNARFAIDGAIQYGRENRNAPPSTDHWLYEYWNIGRQLAQHGATGWDNVTPAPAATLSPLCGAQHAESGKEVGDSVADFDAWMAKRGPLGAGGHPSRAFIAGHAYGVRAAQQAEPEAWQVLEMSDQPDSDRLLDVVLTNGVMREGLSYAVIDWTQVADWRYSAPGTPEAPEPTCMTEEQAEKWAWKQVKLDVGTDGWTAGDSGNYFGFFLWGWRYRAQYERQRAAQLDGGQEGRESNG